MESLPLLLLASLAMRRRYSSLGNDYDYSSYHRQPYPHQYPDPYEQERFYRLQRQDYERRRRREENNKGDGGCFMFLLAFIALVAYLLSGKG